MKTPGITINPVINMVGRHEFNEVVFEDAFVEDKYVMGTPGEAWKQALTFVIVGAGPTGVEFTAELRDFIEDDVPKYYPHLLPVRLLLPGLAGLGFGGRWG